MKRGQAQRVLIYALTAIVGAMLLIFGYRVIGGLMQSGDKLMLVDFRTEFSRDIDLFSSYGSVQTRSYRLPATVREVCVIDLTREPDLDASRYPTIVDSWQSGSPPNVFLIPLDMQFAVERILLTDRASLCIPVRGVLTIRLYGEGNATRIANVES